MPNTLPITVNVENEQEVRAALRRQELRIRDLEFALKLMLDAFLDEHSHDPTPMKDDLATIRKAGGLADCFACFAMPHAREVLKRAADRYNCCPYQGRCLSE